MALFPRPILLPAIGILFLVIGNALPKLRPQLGNWDATPMDGGQ